MKNSHNIYFNINNYVEIYIRNAAAVRLTARLKNNIKNKLCKQIEKIQLKIKNNIMQNLKYIYTNYTKIVSDG